ADGYKLPIMGNLFTAINRGYHGDIGGAVKPGIYFGIDVVTIPAGGEGTTLTKVGRWMSESEYLAMKNEERVIEGAGGQTFVTEGGPHLYTGASPGSIYVEFEVPTNSLLKGGKEGWFKMIGPNAEKSQLFMLQKQGGELLPKYNNLSKALKVK
ncbi:MAG TPA: hypothetical protein VFI29_13475, partial [Hanamia sp.]|nr:hypothetical protein [Hanamia sp.]